MIWGRGGQLIPPFFRPRYFQPCSSECVNAHKNQLDQIHSIVSIAKRQPSSVSLTVISACLREDDLASLSALTRTGLEKYCPVRRKTPEWHSCNFDSTDLLTPAFQHQKTAYPYLDQVILPRWFCQSIAVGSISLNGRLTTYNDSRSRRRRLRTPDPWSVTRTEVTPSCPHHPWLLGYLRGVPCPWFPESMRG